MGANLPGVEHSNTCLHYCFTYGYADLGDYLISKGANDALKNKQGLTCYEGLDQVRLPAHLFICSSLCLPAHLSVWLYAFMHQSIHPPTTNAHHPCMIAPWRARTHTHKTRTHAHTHARIRCDRPRRVPRANDVEWLKPSRLRSRFVTSLAIASLGSVPHRVKQRQRRWVVWVGAGCNVYTLHVHITPI